jgi:hypothetical protein
VDQEEFEFLKLKAAATAAAKRRGAAPVDERENLPAYDQGQRGSLFETAKATLGSDVQAITDLLTMVQRGATLGQSPNIQGIGSMLTGGSFQEGRERMLAQERQAEENLTAGGVPFGVIPEALGGVGASTAIVKQAQKVVPAITSTLGGILTGGGEGTIYAQGQGLDPLSGFLFGAGAPAVAGAVSTTASKLMDKLPIFNAQQGAAQRIANAAEKGGLSPSALDPELTSQMDRLGPDAMLSDVDVMRPFAVGSLGPGSSSEAMAAAFNAANNPARSVADAAITEWDNIFPAPRTKNERGQDVKLTIDQARGIYEQGLNNAKVQFRPDPIEQAINRAFGDRPIAAMKSARNAALSFLHEKAPLRPDGTREPLSARAMLELKEGIDGAIKNPKTANMDALDAKARRGLVQVSSSLNDTLKNYVPEVRTAADIYSGKYADDIGYDLGYDLGSRGLKKQSLADFRETVALLTPAQKQALAEGWRKAKTERADAGGFERQFTRVGPTKSNAELEIIDEIFGPGVGQQFVDASKRITAMEETNKAFNRRWQNTLQGSAAPAGTEMQAARGILDRLVIGSQALTNKLLGGAAQGAIARQGRAVSQAGLQEQNDQIIDWMTRTGQTPQTSEDAMREIMTYLSMAQRAPLPQDLVGQAQRSGAAVERGMRER